MRKYLIFMSLCLLPPGGAQPVKAAPKPSVAPLSWELTFRYQDPQRVSVFLPGRSEPAVYWYMLYTIENNSNREVDFYPQFDLVTDTLQLLRSGVGVSPEAFQAVRRRVGDPLLLRPEKELGRLLCGEDHAKHCVAIWPDFDSKAKAFTIYVSGLSGEFARLRNPTFNPDKPVSETNKRYFILRKTLAIPYTFPGGESSRAMAIPERTPAGQKWIMR